MHELNLSKLPNMNNICQKTNINLIITRLNRIFFYATLHYLIDKDIHQISRHCNWNGHSYKMDVFHTPNAELTRITPRCINTMRPRPIGSHFVNDIFNTKGIKNGCRGKTNPKCLWLEQRTDTIFSMPIIQSWKKGCLCYTLIWGNKIDTDHFFASSGLKLT